MVGKAGLVHSVLRGHLHATFPVDMEGLKRIHFHRLDLKSGDSSEARSPDNPFRQIKAGMPKKKRCMRGDGSRSYAAKSSRKNTNSKLSHRTKRD